MNLAAIETALLSIAYEQSGPPDGPAVLLMHGFPYDPQAYGAVAPLLAAKGLRVIVPYLRGYGPTRFLSTATMRSGQQAALTRDAWDLLDALGVRRAIVSGFDWGGRSACCLAALAPERAIGLVNACGYAVQDIAAAADPAAPEAEVPLWYQHYFQTERGRRGLHRDRAAFCKLLWRLWSPTWDVTDAIFERSAAAFANDDFVDVVIHSYRHRMGNAPGDRAYEAMERALAAKPKVRVPTITFHGADDGVTPPSSSEGHEGHFVGPYQRRVLTGVGHAIPQEAPRAWADAILELADAERR